MSPQWTLDRLLAQWPDATVAARQAGYLLSVYGSVLTKPSAPDLDLIAVPWRLGADSSRFVACLKDRCGWTPYPHHNGYEVSAMGAKVFRLQSAQGHVIDLQVRDVEPTP